jgi:plasmid stabilization system protein ParE
LSSRAVADLDSIAGYMCERDSRESAQKWFNGILSAIESLAEMPQRCPIAEESRDLGREVRVLLFGRKNRAYRVFYAVQGEILTVQVFHVRHWARQTPSSNELGALLTEQF